MTNRVTASECEGVTSGARDKIGRHGHTVHRRERDVGERF